MASGLLTNRNNSSWAKSLNPKTKSKKNHTQVTQTASDDAYSFNQTPIQPPHSINTHNYGSYVNFKVSAFSRTEMCNLRKRLVGELHQIRNLNNRIQTGKLQPKVKKLPSNKRPLENENAGLMKMCRQVLTKVMKHKPNWVFNKPVDAVAMGLHDYHQIIKRPMDLGTVKDNLVKNLYSSPVEFADDVRLTFENAMMYNPKTDHVHVMAIQLLDRFEELYKPISDQLGTTNQFVADELQGSSWNDVITPEIPKKPKPTPMPSISKQIDPIQNQSSSSKPPSKPPSPVARPVKPVSGSGKGVRGKQPKPKAKDPHKREMSMEEKHKLGVGLQNLPEEKMPQLVQIIRKRNHDLAQDGDEIELDIEALDTETLWALDRFVTSWKKFVSKTQREALMGNNCNSAAAITTDQTDEVEASAIMDVEKRPGKEEADEEDVDIDDEMPEISFPPVEINKDDVANVPAPPNGKANSSSSSSSTSGSDSSSSSDSDSGSSSGSDSGADEAQS